MNDCYRNKASILEAGWFPSRRIHWEPRPRIKNLDEGWEFSHSDFTEEGRIAIVAEQIEISLAERFRTQADKWARETQHLSSPTQMMAHPSYQAILGMAMENKREIIRLLLLDLQRNRSKWFWALSYLTQDNPITPSDAGKMDKMISAWVNWGRERDFI
jgi:hypothetical protein